MRKPWTLIDLINSFINVCIFVALRRGTKQISLNPSARKAIFMFNCLSDAGPTCIWSAGHLQVQPPCTSSYFRLSRRVACLFHIIRDIEWIHMKYIVFKYAKNITLFVKITNFTLNERGITFKYYEIEMCFACEF